MQLGDEFRVEVRAPSPGSFDVSVEVDGAWSVTNRSAAPRSLDAVARVHRIHDVAGALRIFRHGYQSWSACGVATFGVDVDPSRATGSRALSRGMHHADPQVTEPGELRSEAVTALGDDGGAAVVLGFLGGSDHDGTFRLRPGPDGPELWIEAFLGGARLAPGECRQLHPVHVDRRDLAVQVRLGEWASRFGTAVGARTGAPYQVGWCSWYHYFFAVTEADVRSNLAAAQTWPFEVFQVDDGYQHDIGDWLRTNDRFPSGVDGTAQAIAAEGLVPGLWLAPFVARPTSDLARAHPDFFARHDPSGAPLVGLVNDGWGGEVWTLDTTRADVLDHLEATAGALVAAGFRYLKLDFTYAPSLPGGYADATRTPAQRVRAGFDAVRRGAGDDAFLLGCGAPLAAVAGVVDGMRIGPDVAPWWEPKPERSRTPGYLDTEPSTLNAWRNTAGRAFLHRRLWLNDPDCVMLRTAQTEMNDDQLRAWAAGVGVSGGMTLLSDDLALLDLDDRRLFEEVVSIGRVADDAARRRQTTGAPYTEDLMESPTPVRFRGGGRSLRLDPDRGALLESTEGDGAPVG